MGIVKVTGENFEKEVLESKKTVVVDFYAGWCGPCQAYAPIIEALASENEDIKVVKIDVDNSGELAFQYQVVSIPTTVIIKNGVEVNRAVGMISKAELLEMIK